MELYKNAKPALVDRGDTNYCGPMAIGILCGVDPVVVAEWLESEGLRQKRKGTPWASIKSAINHFGKKFVDRTQEAKEHGARSVRTCVEVLDPNKSYLVGVRGHVLAIVNGVVHDWSEGRVHRVTEVYEILDGPLGVFKCNGDRAGREVARSLVDRANASSNYVRFRASGHEIKCQPSEYLTIYVRVAQRSGVATVQISRNRVWEYDAFTFFNGHCDNSNVTKQYCNWKYPSLEDAIEAINKFYEQELKW